MFLRKKIITTALKYCSNALFKNDAKFTKYRGYANRLEKALNQGWENFSAKQQNKFYFIISDIMLKFGLALRSYANLEKKEIFGKNLAFFTKIFELANIAVQKFDTSKLDESDREMLEIIFSANSDIPILESASHFQLCSMIYDFKKTCEKTIKCIGNQNNELKRKYEQILGNILIWNEKLQEKEPLQSKRI